ncbi:methyltransferase domain-containing protein [Streptomyces sp. L7]
MDELERHGFRNLTGADISPAMIERAQRLHPATHFTTLDTPPSMPSPDADFDVVLLFAVLTLASPATKPNAGYDRLGSCAGVAQAPAESPYVSDLLLQDVERNRSAGYDDYAILNADHGDVELRRVPATGDGAVAAASSSSREWLTALLADFEKHRRPDRVTVSTMNGQGVEGGSEILARKAALTRRSGGIQVLCTGSCEASASSARCSVVRS